MARSDVLWQSADFYCYPLSDSVADDERGIMAFEPVDPNGAGLVTYLQRPGSRRAHEAF